MSSAAAIIAGTLYTSSQKHARPVGFNASSSIADDILIALYAHGYRVIEDDRVYCNRCGSVFPVEHRCGRGTR